MTTAPKLTPAGVRTMYAIMRFDQFYKSLVWAGLITVAAGAVFFQVRRLVLGDVPRHRRVPIHVLGTDLNRVALVGLCLLFVVAAVLVMRAYGAPDRAIARRLRAAAAAASLHLTARANGVAWQWMFDRFANFDAAVLRQFSWRCWMLASATDLDRLLVVTHTPKGSVGGRPASTSVGEESGIMLFWSMNAARQAFTDATRQRLIDLAFEILETPEGIVVTEIKRCRWRRGERAIDRITVGRIRELWRLCSPGST